MDTETTKIEERLGALERDVAVIKSNYVTKEDLRATKEELLNEIHGMLKILLSMQRDLNSQTGRLVGLVFGFNTLLIGGIYFIASHSK